MGRGLELPNLFDGRGPRAGRTWLKGMAQEDRKVFSEIGRMYLRERVPNFPSLGGKARAAQAKRDKRGRFVKESL